MAPDPYNLTFFSVGSPVSGYQQLFAKIAWPQNHREENIHRGPSAATMLRRLPLRGRFRAEGGFTLIEVLMASAIISAFAVSSTLCLLNFNKWAAQSRNSTAASIILQDRIDQALAAIYNANQNPAILQPTASGADVDGDGQPDGAFDSVQSIVVTRDTSQSAVVSGNLYRRVTAVGTSNGLDNDLDLLQVSFVLQYSFRGQNYTAKAVTMRARD